MSLPAPGKRKGKRPSFSLKNARLVKDWLNNRPGFADLGLRAIVSITRGGFCVRVTHPVDEPIADFVREIDGVPIVIAQRTINRSLR